jgi:hypothetical protein
MVSAIELDAVTQLKLDAEESLDSKSASKYPLNFWSDERKYGDAGASETQP